MEEKTRQEKILVSSPEQTVRLDRFLSERFPDISRSQLQKYIASEDILVNGQTSSSGTRLRLNDEVQIKLDEIFASTSASPSDESSHLNPAPVDFEILFEDDDVLVINKPAGLVVHPGAGTTEPTLVEGVMHYLQQKESHSIDPREWSFADVGNRDRPGIVHRLDKDTSGVLVCAKTPKAHQALSQQFSQKTNLREYVAILQGRLVLPDGERDKTVESYLGRDEHHRLRYTSISEEQYQKLNTRTQESWRYARSHFRIDRYLRIGDCDLTIVRVRLDTGRTHQIRVHARQIGYPILGDALYGKKLPKQLLDAPPVNRQMLHAILLGFDHPTTGKKLAFEASIPDDFAMFLESLLAKI